MITDFWMIMIMVFIVFAICTFCSYIVWEYSNKSKLWVVILIMVVSFLGWTSIHHHNCRIPNILECQKAHSNNLSYNYCMNITFQTTANTNLDKFCLYTLHDNCVLIPDGCIDKADEYIDGYCTSVIPICFLFNKR